MIAKKDHPLSKFTIGNDDTLKKDGVVEALEEYRSKNYSANEMSLVVISGYDLDYLEDIVKYN